MRILNIIVAAVIFGAAAPAYAGAAVCYGSEETPRHGTTTDVEYFARWSGTGNGRMADSAARRDWEAKYRGTPSCTNSGGLESGYLIIIEARTTYRGEDRITMAAGFGSSPGEAEKEAVKQLGMRNWSWEKRHGYRTIFDKRF